MAERVRILVVGLGNMGASHASAYHRNPGFEIVGLCSRNILSKPVPEELRGYPLFADWEAALDALGPDAVSVNTWPNTHAAIAIRAMEAGALGKPLVMRLNLNQQSSGAAWTGHRNLLDSLIPIVDCGVHYVDVMCQVTGARPVRVQGGHA